MATRIEIELTSHRDEQTFTWRKAGAKIPKGEAAVSLFPGDASVGDTFKVDADMALDGITITFVHPPTKERKEPDRLELIIAEPVALVTETRAPKGRGDRDRKDRGKGRGRKDGDGPRGDRGDRGKGKGRGGDNRERPPAKPKLPPKPKPPRLKAGRAHRKAVVDAIPEEQKAIADQVLQGGMQGVRQALSKQNEENKAAGKAEVKDGPILALAEDILSKVRAAEWRDRAEAALEQAKDVDLRDLRQVVNASDGAARDDETRALAASLRTALADRLEADQQAWIAEVIEMLDDDRVVRALHLSSRPPKAGSPLPADVALRLVEMTNASMTKEITSDRWGHILEALAHSPVRRQVVPASLPENPSDDLKALIARLGDRLPEIAHIFGIAPDPKAGKANRRPRKPGSDNKAGKKKPPPPPPKADTPDGDAPKADKPDGDAPKADTPDGDAPKADKPDGDAPKHDTPDGDAVEADKPDGDAVEADTPEGAAVEADKPEAAAPVADTPSADVTASAEAAEGTTAD